MSQRVANLNERTPFWGLKIPPEFKYLQQVLNQKVPGVKLEKKCYDELLKMFRQNDQALDRLKSLSQSHQISLHHLILIYSSLFKLFCAALRRLSSLKSEIVRDDLLDFLKIPNEYVVDFVACLSSKKRESIESSLIARTCPRSVTMSSLSWRVDVSISTSSLSRTLEPSVILSMRLSDDGDHDSNRLVSFELSLASFHLLRFNVAIVLKEMDDLLNRQVFKLTTD